MGKSVSIFLVFCIQFVLWANLAAAMTYMPEGSDETAPAAKLQPISCELAELADSETPQQAPLSEAFADIDLCLPAVIFSKTIVFNPHIPVFNAISGFSPITWLQVPLPRPPKH